LVAVRLPSRGEPVVGVLYVGRTRDPFTMRDARRLESPGDHLALLLDNAALDAASRQRIAAHESERQLRETFVSVLAHDLPGPLSVARIGASLLVKTPERLDERRDLAARIVAARIEWCGTCSTRSACERESGCRSVSRPAISRT